MKKSKPISSSAYKMGCVYGGLIVAAINPIAGAVTAGVLYQLYKSRKVLEDAEREIRLAEERDEFKKKFYARQSFSSYEEYLGSAIWREKRARVVQRAGGRCEHQSCTKAVEEVHHNQYPRIWGREPIEWLEALCETHHREAHGHRGNSSIKR